MMKVNERTRRQKAKSAVEAFPKCPVCNCKKLTLIDQDVFCALCRWDSIEASANYGRSIFPDGVA